MFVLVYGNREFIAAIEVLGSPKCSGFLANA